MRVLIVEDEAQLAAYVRRGLVAEGFAVDVAVDGEEGLYMASEIDYDVVLLDIMLPKRSGYQVCADLRSAGRWVPILMLTAKDGELDEAEALDTGADDYLTKPFSFVVLVARIRSLLRRGAPERPAILSAGDLALDPATREVRRGNSEIDLTSREFSVLECLMRRHGEVVPKLAILESVWDWEYDGDPNIVEVYISALRRKVDAPFGRKSIRTVRGAGYMMASDGA